MTQQPDPLPGDRRISRRKFVGLAGGVSAAAAATGWALGREVGDDATAPQFEPTQANSPEPGYTPVATMRRTLAEENALPGNADWMLTDDYTSELVGFAAPASVAPGEYLRLYLAGSSRSCRVEVFRVGWYQGDGARSMQAFDEVECNAIAFDTDDRRMVSTSWKQSLEFKIPDDWQSGLYAARLDDAAGRQHMLAFTVRSPHERAPIAVLAGTLTSAAYNSWGGYSLYNSSSIDNERAFAVSLDRPANRFWGAGNLARWEMPFVRWFERSGFDADYLNDVDLHTDPDALAGRKLVILVGHHEYYTNEMYDRIEDAVHAGTNIALFGSNALFWRVRLEDTAYGPNRNIVCYKNQDYDPIKDPELTTIRYREGDAPRPEAAILGVQYAGWNPDRGDWILTNDDHPITRDIGMAAGESSPELIWPEYDKIVPGVSPETTVQLGSSSLVVNFDNQQEDSCDTTICEHPSGSRVFATGALDWNFSLDDFRNPFSSRSAPASPADPRLQQLAFNVVTELSDSTL